MDKLKIKFMNWENLLNSGFYVLKTTILYGNPKKSVIGYSVVKDVSETEKIVKCTVNFKAVQELIKMGFKVVDDSLPRVELNGGEIDFFFRDNSIAMVNYWK